MRLLITGYYGAGNFGDDIMLEAVCKKLIKMYPNIKISILKMFEKDLQIDIPKSVKVINFYKIRGVFRKSFMRYLFMKNDIFVWGGGTCFTDEDGDGLYDYMKMAKENGVKIAYLGVGVGKLSKEERIEKIQYLMKNLDFISLRDEKSYEYCKKNVPNWEEKVFLAEDLAYLYFENKNLINKDKKNSIKKNIVVSWRNLINYRTEDEENKLIKELVAFLEILLKDTNNTISILPLDDRKDIAKCESIYIALKNICPERVEFINNLSPAEKVDLLIGCDANISARLHGIFVSEIVGIKTIGLSYSIKIEEFLKSINKESDYLNIDNITKEILMEKFEETNNVVDNKLILDKIEKSNNNIIAFNKLIR